MGCMIGHLHPSALGTTVSLWAHPDDETYLAGGVMAALASAGARVVCLTATRGDGGNGLDRTGTPEQRVALGQLRSTELAAALAELGVSDHRWLEYADGELAAADSDVAVRRLSAIFDEVAADTVLTFGPEGFTGHPDHRTVAAWAAHAVARSERPIRLLQAVVAEGDAATLKPIDDRFDVYYLGVGPPIVADHDVSLRLVLRGTDLQRKVAALRHQASQTAEVFAELGPEVFGQWVATESFREATPLADSVALG